MKQKERLILYSISIISFLIIGKEIINKTGDKKFSSLSSAQRCPASATEEKNIIGITENIYLGDEKLLFTAKVDSGAEVNSLHAFNIEVYNKQIKKLEGREVLFVKFSTVDESGKLTQLERMVSRVDLVRSASGITNRYYFIDKVLIDNKWYEVEINLADRSQLSKKFLVGKNILNKGYLIDTSKEYILTDSEP